MHDESIGDWLDALASAAPAPGGGAAAGLQVAMAAALVEMVCNLTIGRPAYADHEAAMSAARDRARTLRADAVALVGEDAAAFSAVISAYKLPRESDDERGVRSEAIQRALASAADVPCRVARDAAETVSLGESILDGANPNVVSDIAAAAAAARAALDTARVNVEVNAASITDADLTATLAATVQEIGCQCEQADRLVALVRARLAP
jgi:formiminotetrahydrofolate cyclodeaminase